MSLDFYICSIMQKGHYNRIKGALADLGITNKELAAAMKVAPETVSNWCTNARQPSLETLYLVAEYLDIDVRDLLVPNRPDVTATRKK